MLKRGRQLITDFSLVFHSEHGKRVLADLRVKCPAFDRSALQTNPKLDLNTEMYQAGQRSVLLYIYKKLNTDPYEEKSSHAINEEGML